MNKPAFSIYNASAGSGKTYTLVKEYLKIILTSKKDDAYKNILAITFTNKAVHEMKSRIVGSLFDFSNGNPTEKSIGLMQDISRDTALSLPQIIQKSKAIIKNIIHNYAAFDISTIDKFTHKVIRSFAFDLDLPVTFDVSLDTENLIQEAVDSIIAEAGNDEVLTKLLIDFTMEKTDDDKSWDVSSEIFSAGKLVLNENYRNEVLSLQDKSIEDFINLKGKLEQNCTALQEESVRLAKNALQLIDDNAIEHTSFYSGYVPKHFLKLTSGEVIKHVGHYKYLEDGKRYSAKTSQNQKSSIDLIANQLLENLQKINALAEKYFFYKAFLKNITPLSLLNTINNKLKVIQEEQNVLSIAEFNKLINEQIQNQPAPFIYERLGEKYQHFFIDEFQDTSEMQWQNLIPLIDNALSSETLQGEKGSLLIVGDPKQSIYRWRGGKAEQFIGLSNTENPFSNQDKEVFDLERNFRSYDEVITFNNEIFKFLSNKFKNEDYKKLYQENSHQLTNNKKGGFVNISFLSKTNEVAFDLEEDTTNDVFYLRKTLQTIMEVLQKGFALKEIVLLVRNNKHGVLLAKYLTENEIPVISSESLLIQSSSDVQFLLNMLSYLNDKKDKESLARVLYYLAEQLGNLIPVHDFIWEGIQFQEEENLQQWLSGFGFSFNFKNIRRKSLYELVEDLILTGVQSKSNAYVQFFLDVVLERDIKYQMSIGDFLDHWEKSGHKLSVPTAEGSDAIRIMTIHKSKGLEFPVVIFPFAEENYSVNKKEKMWLDAPEEDIDFGKFLIDKSSKVIDYGLNAAAIFHQKSQETLLDNINVLYVALTRAEEQLYIISTIKERNTKGELPNSLASFFIEFLEQQHVFESSQVSYSFGSPQRVSLIQPKENNVKRINPIASVLPSEAIKIAQREALMWGTLQQEAIEFGNVMHEILAFLNSKNDVDWAVQNALESGLITENQKEKVKSKLIEIVTHAELAVFYDENHQVFNERSIVKKGTKTLIPDRVVISQKNAYLLDYKTGQFQEKYKKQLTEYEQALTEMGFVVQKKILVYIGESLEIVNL